MPLPFSPRSLAPILAGLQLALAAVPAHAAPKPAVPAFAGKFNTQQLITGPDCLALQWSQKPGDAFGCTDAQLADWRARLAEWRTARLAALRYDDARYREPALAWARSSFVQPQMMVQLKPRRHG